MNFRLLSIFLSKRKYILLSIFFLLVFLIIVGIFGYSRIVIIINDFLEPYLALVERIANWIFRLLGSDVSIVDHKVIFQEEVIWQHGGINYKKWVLFLMIFFWITPTSIKWKALFSILVLASNFIGSITDVVLTSLLATITPDGHDVSYIGHAPHLLFMLTLLTTWIWRERRTLVNAFAKIKVNLRFIEKKLPLIFVAVYLYAFMSTVVLGCFQYTTWINFLFKSSATILHWLDYQVYVDSHFLIGENGTIYFAKGCLGFNTMLLFAAIVLITSKHSYIKWLYILFGIIILNLVNIIRFVLLFIHIQKHGGYVLNMDLHDMYNYVIYGIVFILWIIWFEKYSDIRESA